MTHCPPHHRRWRSPAPKGGRTVFEFHGFRIYIKASIPHYTRFFPKKKALGIYANPKGLHLQPLTDDRWKPESFINRRGGPAAALLRCVAAPIHPADAASSVALSCSPVCILRNRDMARTLSVSHRSYIFFSKHLCYLSYRHFLAKT